MKTIRYFIITSILLISTSSFAKPSFVDDKCQQDSDCYSDEYCNARGFQSDAGTSYHDAGQGGYQDGGYPGDAGYQGDGGYYGDAGYQGDGGYYGDAGYQSDSGYYGDAGYQGDGGYYGDTGYQGDSGYGDTGYQGDSGYYGDTGYQGDSGYGDTGYQGDSGYRGDTGYQGDSGYHGDTAYQGDAGIVGRCILKNAKNDKVSERKLEQERKDGAKMGDSGCQVTQGPTGFGFSILLFGMLLGFKKRK